MCVHIGVLLGETSPSARPAPWRGTEARTPRVPDHDHRACSEGRKLTKSGMPLGWYHEALRRRLRGAREVPYGVCWGEEGPVPGSWLPQRTPAPSQMIPCPKPAFCCPPPYILGRSGRCVGSQAWTRSPMEPSTGFTFGEHSPLPRPGLPFSGSRPSHPTPALGRRRGRNCV